MIAAGRRSKSLEPPQDGELALARRLDWRFLLPDPDLSDVIVVGRPDHRLLEALARFGGSPIDEAPGPADGPPVVARRRAAGTPARVVVAIRPDVAELTAAAALVEPGGTLYAELAGPLAPPATGGPLGGRVRAARRAARAAGLVDVRRVWHWPSFAAATELIELDDRRVLTAALDRHRGRGRAGGMAERGARALARLGLLPSVVGAVSLVARRPDGNNRLPHATGGATHRDAVAPSASPAGPSTALAAVAGQSSLPPSADRPPGVLVLTPRFRASRHVVGLVVTGPSPVPSVVVKIPRIRDDAWGLEHEREALDALAAQPTGLAAGVPRLLGHGTRWGFPWLAEGALEGRPLGGRDLMADRDGLVERVRRWTAGLPLRSATADIGRLVFEPLSALEDVIVASGGDPQLARLIATTRTALEPLHAIEVPAVVEHRDLAPPNLLLLADGSVGVVDWELAEPDGLPLADLAFFLGWAAAAGSRSGTPETVATAVEAALLDDAGWARRVLVGEATRLGYPNGIVECMLLSVWARALHDLARRARARPDLVRWIAGHRYAAIWRRAVRQVEAADPVG